MNQKAKEYPGLSELEANHSVVQVWNYAKQVMALGIAQAEHAVDQLNAEVRQMVNKDEPGGIGWYRQKAFDYQHGDQLLVINNRPAYLTPNPAARIVQQVSVTESPADGSLTFKVAKDTGGDSPVLTEAEQDGFRDYIGRIKIAGTLITVQSDLPDKISYNIVVEADPAVLTGHVRRTVYQTLDRFHQSIEFNTVLYLSKATDALQAIPGIIDVEITSAYAGAAGVSLTENHRVNRKYETIAGYVKLDRNDSSVTLIRG